MDTGALERLREKILASDNRACFIERETLLRDHAEQTLALPEEERYLFEFELLLGRLSTPVDPDDRFAGRMAEARWPYPEPFTRIPGGIGSEGHITLPMPEILAKGLDGIAAEVSAGAARIDTPEARFFERNALGCIAAIRGFCNRYADAAEAAGKPEAAAALRQVPCGPAYDLFSALQSVWIMQFITSTVCGARDFAPGRIDRYLLHFFRAEPDRGRALELLAFFLVKFNEITGTATDNFEQKPIPCTSSKQYLTLGGRNAAGEWEFNALTALFVEAAELVRLPQPTLNFRIGPGMPEEAWQLAGRAAHGLDAQCNFFNDLLIVNKLLGSGILPEDAWNYAFTACNRVDLPGRLYNIMRRIDVFDNSFEYFREALFSAAEQDGTPPVETTLDELRRIAEERMLADIRENRVAVYSERFTFRFESLFFASCIQSCREICRMGAENYRWMHRMFSGIANMADSLAAVERLVVREKRLTFREFAELLEADFSGAEVLREEIVNRFPKYGNGEPGVDALAAAAADALIDAAESAGRKTGFLMMPSIYSLTLHARFGSTVGATPDGRHAGEPVSENQSPEHGADRESPTALFASVSRLPLRRCICGGLNLKLGCRPSADRFAAMLRSFFELGGLHIGFTVVNRRTLEAARRNPEEYRTLLIRKTGFSEFFTSLSPAEQQEIIDRTEY